MRKVIVFIAMSLDGYIADKDGNVDWLAGQNVGADDMQSYQEFIKNIDTVIMGWNTYDQIATKLSPTEWLYRDLRSYVLTHREQQLNEQIIFTKDAVGRLLHRLQQEKGKDIWICGGANLVHQLIKEQLIDRYYISIIPILLGDGIRLFDTMEQSFKLNLVQTINYNGIVDLVYEPRV